MATIETSTAPTLAAVDAAAGDFLLAIETAPGQIVRVPFSAALDAFLRVAAASGILCLDSTKEKLVIRKRGGVVGTDEVQISHDGTATSIESMDGGILFKVDGITRASIISGGGLGVIESIYDTITGGSNYIINSSGMVLCKGPYNLRDPLDGQIASGLSHAAKRVIGITDGATGGGTFCSTPLNDTISASVNDYNPGPKRHIHIAPQSGSLIVSGIVAGVDGQEMWITNTGNYTLAFNHNDTNSVAVNRFSCPGNANIFLSAGQGMYCHYDATITRWRVAT